ncbi:LTA synthase family protein [Fictibacillus phosphorivorans]|uniref:LTA synthase family protein n=1 Tax=Fictibacillus phosphorivorans TaxID=1221500 RepID=UPI00203D4B12|nr:LTA synthase family protein [Fictibacillus phosphorivorans]MCM3718482.1 LTA synthase family protein [Fictibacillus phosphorivorans]MCM3776162.1 LTA synthase family protein [Fictibacillus phosphorivorans]
MKRLKPKFYGTLFSLFIVSCVLKILFTRYILFEEVNFLDILSLEFSYILLFACLIEYIPTNKVKIPLYISLNLIISTLFFAIIVYHSYFGNIPTYYALMQTGQVGAVKDSVTQLLQPEYFLLYVDFLVMLIVLLTRKLPLYTKYKLSKTKLIGPLLAVSFAVCIINLYLHKDEIITNSALAAETKGIFNYEALQAYYGPNGGLPQPADLSDKELKSEETIQDKINEIKGIKEIPDSERKYFGAAKDCNLILIQFESMQDFPIGLKMDGKEVTPNMNKLIKNSFYFNNLYQQTGAGNTSDAEFIANTSFYPAGMVATSTFFEKKAFPSMPKRLQKEGYETFTLHADKIDFWNRVELYPSLGFNKYYALDFFGKEDLIGLGPSDEVLINKGMSLLKNLHAKNKPFYAHFISMTSHHPYEIPPEKKVFELPAKYKGSIVGKYIQAINYNDMVLGKFIDQLKKEGIWENTVLAFYGDHMGMHHTMFKERDPELLKELLGHEYTKIDRFNVPFMITAPGVTDDGMTSDQLAGQLDIMPTLANLLGISLKDHVHFGQDLLNDQENLIGMRYYMPAGSFFNDEVVFQPGKSFEDGEALILETAKKVPHAPYKEDYDRILKLLSLSDAYLKSLPEK